MDESLESVAIASGGFIARTTVLDYGNTDADIRDAIASRRWTRVRRGYFSPTPWLKTLSPEGRYVVLVRIAIARFGRGVAASHSSACAVRGRALYAQDLSTVQLTRLDGRSGRDEAGVRHRSGRVREDDIEMVDGLPCTVEPRALWESALDTTIEGGMVTFDSALHADPGLLLRLIDIGPRFRQWPGARHADIALRLADGGSETPGESRGRHLFWRYDIPRPELQRNVVAEDGRLIGRTDWAWLEGRHLGEFDGMVKYQRELRAGESASAVVVREKLREDELRREGGGAGMSRLVWWDLDPPRQPTTAARVHAEIDQSARLYIRNRVVIPLTG